MAVYKVFNEKNVAVKVKDEDLDNAILEAGFVPTHLANAAAMSRRLNLLPRLRLTLLAESRKQKIAAARALLAMSDVDAIPELERIVLLQEDPIVVSVFQATSIRLKGSKSSWSYFDSPSGDPLVKSMLIAIYDGYMDLEEGDIFFLIHALQSYMEKGQVWMASMKQDVWAARIDIMVASLASQTAIDILSNPSLSSTLEIVVKLLILMDSVVIEKDTRIAARNLTSNLLKISEQAG